MTYEYKAPRLSRSKDLYHLTRSHIEIAPAQILPIEFPFLKEFMIGILPTELLLVGAKSGSGKTQWLTEMALMWARSGKRVGFVALEAEPEEIEQRILFKLYCQAYLKDPVRDRNIYLDFRRWRFGMLESVFAKYHQTVQAIFEKETENLYTHYMQKSEFTIIDLVDLMDEIQTGCDVCIVDHLHYFDLMEGSSDLTGMKKLMKRIREINLKSGIPFVMAAHLRKDIQKMMPDLEDFMGSSDIPKIATSAILLASKPGSYRPDKGTVTTLFSVPKLRQGGGSKLLAEIEFSMPYQSYLPFFSLSMQNLKGDKLEPLQKEHYPRWAKTLENEKEPESYDF